MKAVLHDDLAKFLGVTAPLYEADPLRHTVALTVLNRRLRESGPQEAPPILVTVHGESRLRGAAFCTPPWYLGVSGLPAECAPAAVDVLVGVCSSLPGVVGPTPEAEAFAAAWSSATGCGTRVEMPQRLYRLGDLVPPETPGSWRLAVEADARWLGAWRTAFGDEATGGLRDPAGAEESTRRSIAVGEGNVLWEIDGRPVSWASARTPVAGMSRIGPVYTPVEHRGRGYGSAVTAAASLWARAAGARDVVLFTDLTNPVSNSIYQRIGYRPLYDFAEITFTG